LQYLGTKISVEENYCLFFEKTDFESQLFLNTAFIEDLLVERNCTPKEKQSSCMLKFIHRKNVLFSFLHGRSISPFLKKVKIYTELFE